MFIAISCVVDTSKLSAGIAAAAQYTRRTMAQLVNTAAFEVALAAADAMPFVPQDRIDADLAVITLPVLGKRGKPLKRKKNYGAGVSAIQRTAGVPLAVLIIQAQTNLLSRYSFMSHGAHARPHSPFYGVSRQAGQAAMAAAVSRLIKARHSSTKFLAQGFYSAAKDLKPYTVNKWRFGGGGRPASDVTRAKDFGSATPAVDGGWAVFAVIENSIGMRGKNAANFNAALLLYGTGPLQRALDNEGQRNMNYALTKMGGELKQVTEAAWR